MPMLNPKAGPLYRQIAEWLGQRIAAGDLRPGDALESEQELCKRFGVSRITVRASLKELEQEGVVRRFPGKGTFVTEPHLRRPENRQPTIAFIVNTAANPWAWPIIAAAEATVREFGCNLAVGDANHDVAEEARLVDKYRQMPEVGGILLIGVEEARDHDVVLALKAGGTPYVMVDHYIPQIESDVVVFDDFGGAYAGTEHLIELGHRAILLLSEASERTSSIADRVAGFRKACLDHQLTPGHQHEQVLTRLNPEPGRPGDVAVQQQVDEIMATLRAHPQITAVFGLNDTVAMHAVQAAKRLRRRVPDQLSVVGFGDIFPSSLETPMTNVYVDRAALGAQAARLLLARMASPALPLQRVTLPVRLMVRESTAASPAALPL